MLNRESMIQLILITKMRAENAKPLDDTTVEELKTSFLTMVTNQDWNTLSDEGIKVLFDVAGNLTNALRD